MRPLAFYRLGLQLAQRATTEPIQRSAVNRLYYGLHHEACCRYFRTNPVARPINRNRRHTDLRNRYYQAGGSTSLAVSRNLKDLMVLRRMADYQLSPPFRFKNRPMDAAQLLQAAIQSAEQLLNALEAYSPGEAEDGCNCPQAYTVG